MDLRPGTMDADIVAEMEADDYHARDYVRPGDVVVDVGANVGAFARFVHAGCPEARIVCFEPMPENFAALERNVEGIAEAERVALAAQAGTLTIYDFGADASGCHSMFDLGRVDAVPVETPAKTLEQALAERAIDRVRLLKLDCQGAEYEIVPATSHECLDRIDYIALEVHAGIAKPGEMLGEIDDHGRRKTTMVRHLLVTHVPLHGDVDWDSVQVWARRPLTSRAHRARFRVRGAARGLRTLLRGQLRR
jgi:FkbM family methyltransferase